MFEEIEGSEVGAGVFRYRLVGWRIGGAGLGSLFHARCVVTVDGGAAGREEIARFDSSAPKIADAMAEVERWALWFVGLSTTRRQELVAVEPGIYQEGKAHIELPARRTVVQ